MAGARPAHFPDAVEIKRLSQDPRVDALLEKIFTLGPSPVLTFGGSSVTYSHGRVILQALLFALPSGAKVRVVGDPRLCRDLRDDCKAYDLASERIPLQRGLHQQYAEGRRNLRAVLGSDGVIVLRQTPDIWVDDLIVKARGAGKLLALFTP